MTRFMAVFSGLALPALRVSMAALLALASIEPAAQSQVTIDFDNLAAGDVVSDQYVSQGIIFGDASRHPVVFGFYRSAVSPPNALVSEAEGGRDLNPGLEHGNNEPYRPIEFRFCVAPACQNQLAAASVEFQVLWLNQGNAVEAIAYNSVGQIIDRKQAVSTLNIIPITLGGPVHRVVVRFLSDLPGSSTFEDIAAIDDIVFTGLVAADAHPTR